MTKWSSWQHPNWVKWISIFNNAPPLDDWKAKLESNTPARKTEAKPHSRQTTILGLHYLEECKTPTKRNKNKLIQKKKKSMREYHIASTKMPSVYQEINICTSYLCFEEFRCKSYFCTK